MNKETMRKHYERTPKETLINILISSREQVEKLQNRNKEHKQEVERLNNIINELEEYMIGKDIYKILLYKLRDLKEGEKE